VPSTTITTNVGVSVDLMKGVSATNSIGYDATKDISMEIIDYGGDDVSSVPSYAINHPGKYTVKYRYKDPAGEEIKVEVTFNVRSTPTLTLNSSDFTYLYNTALSPTANKDALTKIISDNATSSFSYEGKAITVKSDVAAKIPSELANVMYTVTYTVDDGFGLSNTASAKITVKDVNVSTVGSTQSTTQSSMQ